MEAIVRKTVVIEIKDSEYYELNNSLVDLCNTVQALKSDYKIQQAVLNLKNLLHKVDV